MKKRVARLFLWLILIPYWLTAQSGIPIGSWRTHFSYRQAHLLALDDEQVYVATQNGLFTYHFQENTLSTLSKLDGLSDAGISTMSYQESTDLLILAYHSGIVDLLSEGNINTFDLLAGTGESINAISYRDRRIYLATSEGVRVLLVDEENLEANILESYTRLGSEGEPLPIFDVAISGDSIFLASEEGVLANSLADNINRQDFRSWQRFGLQEGLPGVPVRYLAGQGEDLFAALDGRGVYIYQDEGWELSQIQTEEEFNSLRASEQRLLATTRSQVWVLGESLEILDTPAPQDAALAADGTLWIADGKQGLVRLSNGQQEAFSPNGPLGDDIYSIHTAGERTIALQEKQAAFSVFEEGRWTNYDSTYLREATGEQELALFTDAVYLPADEHFYFGSAGSGLLRWDGQEDFNLITTDDDNSLANNEISALAAQENLLWVSNYATANSLHRYNARDESWESFAPTAPEARFPLDLVLVNDAPWLLSGQGDVRQKTGSQLLAFDPETGDTQSIRSVVALGNLPGSIFTALAQDLEGQAWLAGNEGISYLPLPAEVFSNSTPAVIKPIFENQFLLFGEYISALAIDGGNRKWVGTREGIWLFEENGEALVSRFTADNSPLPSDNILEIAIEAQSGEVFILTDQGLISYRGTASEGQPVHQNVKIFPNPVPYQFNGLVGIEGLVSDAIVKITTISGQLVRQLQAEGGTATWNVLDYNGSRVASGVYLVFSASADGSETFVGKIAVIN